MIDAFGLLRIKEDHLKMKLPVPGGKTMAGSAPPTGARGGQWWQHCDIHHMSIQLPFGLHCWVNDGIQLRRLQPQVEWWTACLSVNILCMLLVTTHDASTCTQQDFTARRVPPVKRQGWMKHGAVHTCKAAACITLQRHSSSIKCSKYVVSEMMGLNCNCSQICCMHYTGHM